MHYLIVTFVVFGAALAATREPTPTPRPVVLDQPTREAAAAMHEWYVRDFVAQEDFGFRRVLRIDHLKALEIGGKKYYVAGRRLIGLWIHDEPRVYEAGAWKKRRLNKVSSRALRPREAEAVAELRRGSELHVAGDRMYGAVRARKACLECHDVEPGQLLGVFRYDLETQADRLRRLLAR